MGFGIPLPPMEYVSQQNPSAASEVEFTGLNGQVYLIYYKLYCSAETELRLQLNGVTTVNYYYRRMLGNAIGSGNAYYIPVVDMGDTGPSVGDLIISGKQVSTNNRLSVAHCGSARTYADSVLLDGYLNASDGDLSSIKLSVLTGIITGNVRVIKVM